MQLVENLCQHLAKLPGLGPRSAKRITLALLENVDRKLTPLIDALQHVALTINKCNICGNLDEIQPCHLCQSPSRDSTKLCIVEHISDLWALERVKSFNGHYHVLGGVLSPLCNQTIKKLNLQPLLSRVANARIKEVILATSPSVEGQLTAQYIVDLINSSDICFTRLGQGIPIGGDLDYLDEATLKAALNARQKFI